MKTLKPIVSISTGNSKEQVAEFLVALANAQPNQLMSVNIHGEDYESYSTTVDGFLKSKPSVQDEYDEDSDDGVYILFESTENSNFEELHECVLHLYGEVIS